MLILFFIKRIRGIVAGIDQFISRWDTLFTYRTVNVIPVNKIEIVIRYRHLVNPGTLPDRILFSGRYNNTLPGKPVKQFICRIDHPIVPFPAANSHTTLQKRECLLTVPLLINTINPYRIAILAFDIKNIDKTCHFKYLHDLRLNISDHHAALFGHDFLSRQKHAKSC